MRAAHPHPIFLGVPSPGLQSRNCKEETLQSVYLRLFSAINYIHDPFPFRVSVEVASDGYLPSCENKRGGMASYLSEPTLIKSVPAIFAKLLIIKSLLVRPLSVLISLF